MVDENDLEMESSPISEEQGADAESPTAADETEDELLAVVQSALQEDEAEDAASSAESDEEVTEEVTAEAGEDTDEDIQPSDEEGDYEDVPFNQHPRFKELIAEKNELKPLAENYRQITDFLSDNNINAEEAAEGFQIMALIKNDPVKAREALQPWIDELDLHSGNRFSDDIEQRLDQGYLDEQAAADLQRSRMAAEMAQGREAIMQEQLAKASQQRQLDDLAAVVTDWEERKQQSDPDYSLKQDEMDDRVKALVSEFGQPQNAEQAIQLVEAAYETVNARYAARRPQKKAVRTASGGNPAGTPAADPTSVLEVIEQTLQSG